MKATILKGLCGFAIILSLAQPRNAGAQTNYSVPVTLSISNTAIDRVIGTEWASIQHSWSGTFYYGPYSVSLNQPVIILADNAMKIRMTLNVSCSIYSGSFTITPTLTIPPTTISMSNIITAYQDLQQQINNYVTDSYLRTLIYSLLSPITWYVHQGQILNQSASLWSSSSYIGWYGTPSLTFAIANNALNITVTPTVVAAVPSYTWQWERTDLTHFGVQIYSNDAIQITYFRIFTSLPQQILETYTVASSVWDGANNRYVTTLVAQSSSGVANSFDLLEFQIRLKRQYAETLWDLITPPVLGYPYSWTSFSSVNNKRGE